MLGLLVLLSAPAAAADVAADRVEIRDGAWRAEGDLRVDAPTWRLRAPAARGDVTAACPDGRLLVEGPARLTLRPEAALAAGDVAVEAGRLQLCLPGPTGRVDDVAVRASGWRLDAREATLEHGGALRAAAVSATACACDDPPWRVTAAAAEVTPGEGAWAEWPVLWAGPVPVAAAPLWYVPFSRRRTGFLLPELGWDGEDGPFGRVPFFWAAHRSLDLTLEPGWRAGWGATAGARLRWAADEDEGGALHADAVVGEGFVAWGAGSVPMGPARLALAGEATDDLAVRRALRPGLAARRRDHLRSRASLTVGDGPVVVGVGASLLQDLRRATADLLPQPGVYQPAPEAWLAWTAPLPLTDLRLDARFTRFDGADVRPVERVALEAGLDATWWLGPLRLRPDAALLTHRVGGPGDEGDGARWAAAAGLEAAVGVGRTFERLRHEVWLAARGRHVGVGARGDAAALDALDRPLDSDRVELAASTRLAGPDASATLEVSVGYEARAPVAGREAPVVAAAVDTRLLGLEALAAGADAVRARARAGRPDGPRLEAGYARLRLEPDTPRLLRWWVGGIPRAFAPDAPDLDTLDGRVAAPFGRLEVAYGLVADPDGPAVLGQDAALAWRGGCGCWSARLRASHQRGRDAPDLWLEVALGPAP